MKTFKDAQERSWDIAVNVYTAKRVRDVVGVDLFKIFTDEGATVLADPFTLVCVFYNLCQKQCEERNVSEEDFGRAMVGDPLEHAAQALLEEVIAFFPQSRRAILTKVLDKSKEAAEAMTAEAMTKLETLNLASLIAATTSRGKSE